jgi:hypothetical protein
MAGFQVILHGRIWVITEGFAFVFATSSRVLKVTNFRSILSFSQAMLRDHRSAEIVPRETARDITHVRFQYLMWSVL